MTENFMAQRTKEIWEGFVRQRRNLIIISLVLLFAETSELSISKLNVFGNELLISNPMTVNYALWAAWFYWLVRYYQYFLHAHGRYEIKEAYSNRLEGNVRELVRKRALPQCQNVENYFFREIERKSLRGWSIAHGERIRTVVDGRADYKEINRTDTLAFRNLLLPRLRSWFYVVFQTRHATEYILPFLVALAPLAHALFWRR
jgi:hypothetical protein